MERRVGQERIESTHVRCLAMRNDTSLAAAAAVGEIACDWQKPVVVMTTYRCRHGNDFMPIKHYDTKCRRQSPFVSICQLQGFRSVSFD